MAEIIDLDFYRKFRVALPIRQQKASRQREEARTIRRHRRPRRTGLQRPIHRNTIHHSDK